MNGPRAALLALALPLAGCCHVPMADVDQCDIQRPATPRTRIPMPTNELSAVQAHDPNAAVIRFTEHSFSSYCYDTMDCSVLYAGVYDTHFNPTRRENELYPPMKPDELERLSGNIGGIRNFPPPAIVTWRSKDGVPHEAAIDFGAIFHDQRIRHHVPTKDVYPTVLDGSNPEEPAILLIVNDRTISVYMKASILLNAPEIPGNRYSDVHEEAVLAYTHTFAGQGAAP